MKRIHWLISLSLMIVLAASLSSARADVAIDETNFPDENFRNFISTNFDADGDDTITDAEISEIWEMDCSEQNIASLDGIEHFTRLNILKCSKNTLMELDVSKCENLNDLDCSYNELKNLKVNNDLEYLQCEFNQLERLDVSLQYVILTCHGNLLKTLDVSLNQGLCWAVEEGRNISAGGYDFFTYIEYGDFDTRYSLYVDPVVTVIAGSIISEGRKEPELPPASEVEDVAIDEDCFPDTKFRSFVKSFDEDKDGVLNGTEILNITTIDCSDKSIVSLQGIEKFIALKELYCDNNRLENLNLSKNTLLGLVHCNDNKLISLDLSGCAGLTELNCSQNMLTTCDLSNNSKLNKLNCGGNQLTEMDMTNCTQLTELFCDNNKLQSLDVSMCSSLKKLDCKKNKLSRLIVKGCASLAKVECYDNQFSELDLSDTEIGEYICSEPIERQHQDDGIDYFKDDDVYTYYYIYFDQAVRVIADDYISEPAEELGSIVAENGVYKLDHKDRTAVFVSIKKKTATTLKILDTVTYNKKEYPVISIKENACEQLSRLKKVTIGKNIKKIGKYAFSGCEALKKVIGGSEVTEIEEGAFSWSGQISVPAFTKLKSLGSEAFRGCSSLKEFKLSKLLKKIPEDAFSDCTNLQKITGGDNVKVIEDNAFRNCESLTSLPAFSKLEKLGKYAFCRTMITEFVLSDKVKTIGSNAFDSCTQLQKVTGGKSVTKIGARAFTYCLNLQSMVTFPDLKTIGLCAFIRCESLEKVTIPKNVNKIGESAFRYCSKLNKIIIKSKLLTDTNIGKSAFRDIGDKPAVTCPKGMKKIYRELLQKKGMPGDAVFK